MHYLWNLEIDSIRMHKNAGRNGLTILTPSSKRVNGQPKKIFNSAN